MTDQVKWDKAKAFHGHECPGLAIGFATVKALTEHIPTGISADEQIVCITENDTCACDAIQSILSCTFGKGNLIYRSTGKMAFNFYFRDSGKKLRLYFKAANTENLDREAWRKKIFSAAANELFDFSEPTIELPEQARIFNSVACDLCGEKAREDKIRLQNGKKVCLGCFKPYDR
jgi:formylmethanofuran dehydrogenase subunit E